MLQHAFRDGLEIDMTTVPCRLTTYTLALPDRDDSDIYPSTCLLGNVFRMLFARINTNIWI